MAGYDFDRGMSNNAVAAYDVGLVPFSKIGRGIPRHLVDRYCGPLEWHHSSKFYNRVDFYDKEAVLATFGLTVGEEGDADAVAAFEAYKRACREADAIQPDAPEYFEKCRVEWVEFTGSRKHPRPISVVHESVCIRVKGDNVDILTPNGIVRKKAFGRHYSEVRGKAITPLQWTRRANKVVRK